MSTDPHANRLRAAADALTSEFSDDLHASVMRQVRREAMSAPGTSRHRPTFARWTAVAGVAAAVLVAAKVWVFQQSHPHRQPMVETPVAMSIPSLPSWSETVAAVSQPIARQLADARQAYADHGPGRLAQYCWDQLDVLPAPPHASPATNSARDDNNDHG